MNPNRSTAPCARGARVLTLLAALAISARALGAAYYVSPAGKDTNPATREAPWSLDKANSIANAGDTVVLLDGNYDTPIAPANSGGTHAPIRFNALNAGKAIFGGGAFEKREAIVLSGRSNIVIDSITVNGAKRFIFAEGESTHHITVQNCRFDNASQVSFESCRFRNVGDGIEVIDCRIAGGNDLLAITGGKNHHVEGNFFGDASHTGLALIMVQRSVVRDNHFTNSQGKMMEVFNTRDVKEPHRLAEYNLIEGNWFDTGAGEGVQYAGSRSIVRKNVFRRCRIGMQWANYLGSAKTPEAWYGESNRFYNNVLFECGPAAASGASHISAGGADKASASGAGKVSGAGAAVEFQTNRVPPSHYGDQLSINNIIAGNVGGGDKSAATTQISFNWDATPDHGRFFYNDILANAPGESVVYWLDAPYHKPPLKQNMTLREFETLYPSYASHNLEVDPQFVNAAEGDFHLKPDSACIDAGGPLTTVATDSSGEVVRVADALFFTDGYGIDLVHGDAVRIAGQRARVIKVDYQANELTLDQAVPCQAGAAVQLDYLGAAPDLGAFECH